MATTSESLLKQLSAILFTSLLHQAFLIFPLVMLYIKRKGQDSGTTIIYYRLLVGFGLGLAPALTIVMQDKWPFLDDQSFGILKRQSLLTLFIWPILTGLWGGITGSFIAEAIRDHKNAFGWILFGMVVPSFMSALYLLFSSSSLGFLIISISILAFATFVGFDDHPAK